MKGGKLRLCAVHGVPEALNALEKNLGCIYVRWSTTNQTDHSVSAKDLKRRVLKVWEWYGLERLSSTLESGHLVRSHSAMPSLLQNFHDPTINSE